MAVEIFAQVSPGERRVALCQDGVLTDFFIERPGAPDGVGDLHRGRVQSRVPAMAGAFVALEGATGFLADSEGAAGISEGSLIGVRVTRAGQGGKGPRLTSRGAEAAAEGPMRLVARGPGPLLTLGSRYPTAPIWMDGSAALAALRPQLGPRLGFRAPAFDQALDAEIDALSLPEVTLPGGMRATITPTPALVAIDMDGGGATADRAPKAAAQMARNLGAIPELARQIRLRNLGGAILVDFAGMPAKKRAALAPALRENLAADPLCPRLLGFTALGFAEILRPRVHPPLHEALAGPHAAALRALRDAVALKSRTRLRASPSIIAALQADPVALAEFAASATYPLTLRSDPSVPGYLLEEAPDG
jgi:hypothetical protein